MKGKTWDSELQCARPGLGTRNFSVLDLDRIANWIVSRAIALQSFHQYYASGKDSTILYP